MQAGAVAWMASVSTPTTPYSELIGPFIVAGVGMALFFAPVANLVLSAVRPEEEGKSSGANNAIRELGGVFGVAVLASIFDVGGYGTGQNLVDGMHPALFFGSGIVALGALAAFMIPCRPGVVEELEGAPELALRTSSRLTGPSDTQSDPEGACRLPNFLSGLETRARQLVDVVLDQARTWIGSNEIPRDHLCVCDFSSAELLRGERLELIVRLLAFFEQKGSASRINCLSVASSVAPGKTIADRRRSSSADVSPPRTLPRAARSPSSVSSTVSTESKPLASKRCAVSVPGSP